MRRLTTMLLLAAAITLGQEAVKVELADGSTVIGSLVTGDPKSFVIETDSGRVTVIRSAVARVSSVAPEELAAGRGADSAELSRLGFAAGQKAADDAVSGAWSTATCCASSFCWPVAAPAAASLAWRSKVAVPARLLEGKSGSYATGFTEGYLRLATAKRRTQTITGIVGGGVLFTIAVFVMRHEVEHMFDDVHLDLGWGDL